MSETGRYLRWLLPVTAVLLMMLENDYRSHVFGIDIALFTYAAVIHLIAVTRERVSKVTVTTLTACDLAAVSLLYFTFPIGFLLLYYPLFLFRAETELGGGGALIAAAVVGALAYYTVNVFVFVLDKDTADFTNIVLRFLFYPASAAACTALIIRIGREARRQAEGQRDESIRKLGASNDTLATLSHEFRTPLTIIRSSAQILSGERPGGLNDVQRRFLSTIEDNTSRLIRLADDLLARTRVDSTWLTVEVKELDIRPIVKNVIETMSPFAEQHQRHLRYSYPHILSSVLADQKWIHQVLVNLVHNAIKYTDPNGTIVLAVKENEECAVVSVTDNGGGIWSNRTVDVFKKYFQEQHHVDGSSDGAGLGLAIVKEVVEKHNGNVYVGSVPGMGSIFSFTLPVARRASPNA